MALREVVASRELALDVCPGEGALLDVLCPIFARVVLLEAAVGSPSRAERRAVARGYLNVEVLKAEPSDALTRDLLGAGADLVVAAYLAERSLERPSAAALTRLLGPRGRLVVLEADPRVEWRFASAQSGSDGLEQLCSQRLPSERALGASASPEWRVWSGVRSGAPPRP